MTDKSPAPSAVAEIAFSRGGLMLADGSFFEGTGFGAEGVAVGDEVAEGRGAGGHRQPAPGEAVLRGVFMASTLNAAKAAAQAIRSLKTKPVTVLSLQERLKTLPRAR